MTGSLPGERGQIRVLRRGGGPASPVVLLHGFTGCAEAWGEPILEELARRGPVLAVDLPGHGRSEAPPDPMRYTMARVVEDLLGVLDRAEVRAADWVGYSMGGRIALAATARHPGRVRRLVLESASPGLDTRIERVRRRRQDEEIARRIEAEGIAAFVDFWMSRPLFASQRRLTTAVLQRARHLRMQHDPSALAAVLRGLGTGSQPSFWDRLDGVHVPVLLLTGEEDAKFGALARAMAERFPRATNRTVPHAGHAVHQEAPRAWIESIASFLDAAPGPP